MCSAFISSIESIIPLQIPIWMGNLPILPLNLHCSVHIEARKRGSDAGNWSSDGLFGTSHSDSSFVPEVDFVISSL